MAKREERIQMDEFIKLVRPDPKSTPGVVVLQGFIGESSEAGHIRLYSDIELTRFIEVPADAVLHSTDPSTKEEVPKARLVWVKEDAVYTYGDPATGKRPKASFLQGDLLRRYETAQQVDPRAREPQWCHNTLVPCAFPTNICRIPTICKFSTEACGGATLCAYPTEECAGGTLCAYPTENCRFPTPDCGRTFCAYPTDMCRYPTITCRYDTLQCYRTMNCAGGTVGCGGFTIDCGGTIYDPTINQGMEQFRRYQYYGAFNPYR